MTLIKSISGIRGTIGGPAGENLTPPDVVKFTTAYVSRELQPADTVTEKLPATPTGDEAPLTLWVIVLAACAGLALLLLVLRRRNSHRTA